MLKEYISEQCLNEHPSDPSNVLAEAHLIRLERQIKIKKCNFIAERLESEELKEPVRSWLNEHLEELNSKIKSVHVIDIDKYISCTNDILVPYFELITSVLEDFHPTLIFGADEHFMLRNGPKHPNFPAMFCNNCVGISVPLFFTNSNYKKLTRRNRTICSIRFIMGLLYI